jgi:nicotinate-nucleotide adenylyltransferase
MTRLGLFGGTFDPPHLGHLILAAEACECLHLDKMLFILTPDPPHKRNQKISPIQYRKTMLSVALAGNSHFEISTIDIDRPPPHYALDTVRLLRQRYSPVEMIYLMGADSLRDLSTWHRPHEFVAACDAIGVMRRPRITIHLESLEEQFAGLTAKIIWIPAPLIGIASKDIRKRVAEGRAYQYMVPADVYEIINRYHLYQGSE